MAAIEKSQGIGKVEKGIIEFGERRFEKGPNAWSRESTNDQKGCRLESPSKADLYLDHLGPVEAKKSTKIRNQNPKKKDRRCKSSVGIQSIFVLGCMMRETAKDTLDVDLSL